MARAGLILMIAAMIAPPAAQQPAAQQAPAAAMSSSLDYDVFRTRVQPILMSPRKGNARCIACHSRGGGNAYLEPLAPGSTINAGPAAATPIGRDSTATSGIPSSPRPVSREGAAT